MPILKGYPDWVVYAGGGVVLGGGYLLYRKRKSASATSAPVSQTGADLSGTYSSASGQQSSIVPYYLTGNSGQDFRSPGGGTTQGPPLPTPSGPPGGDNVSTGTLPVIPPILPNVNTQTNIPQPPPAPTPPPTGTPVAPTQNNNIPSDLLAKIQAAGEQIISSVAAPNGGVWYLGSKGGVFAINAPFYGSPVGQSYWGSRKALQIVPNGNGYTVIDTAGERYSYGP